MLDYITKDLIHDLTQSFSSDSAPTKLLDVSRMSIMGHSMGGLGALNLFFKTGIFKVGSIRIKRACSVPLPRSIRNPPK